jgi:hypothetical protein
MIGRERRHRKPGRKQGAANEAGACLKQGAPGDPSLEFLFAH